MTLGGPSGRAPRCALALPDRLAVALALHRQQRPARFAAPAGRGLGAAGDDVGRHLLGRRACENREPVILGLSHLARGGSPAALALADRASSSQAK